MFSYRKYDIEVVRHLAVERLSWPGRGEAADESYLGCNRAYMDLRRAWWTEAKEAFDRENELIARLEASDDPEEEYYAIEELIYEDENLYSLDFGMASTVLALSAAGRIPFSSCNAGAFGGHHAEHFPLVAFYAQPGTAQVILSCAEQTQIGLDTSNERGHLIVYADDIRSLRRFAAALIEQKGIFRRAKRARKRVSPPKAKAEPEQGSLF
jgi:hypothetical protein